jgi:hypothetical protein
MHSAEARPKAQNRIHKEKMRPAGRILTYMPFDFEIFGRISAEQRVAVMLHSLMRSGVDQALSFACQFTDLYLSLFSNFC